MKTFALTVLVTTAIISTGCGATRRVSSTVAPGPSLTSATIQFNDREHGKDANSAVDVWVLHGSNEMAHLHSIGNKFDDVDFADAGTDVRHVFSSGSRGWSAPDPTDAGWPR
jgi:hypothetical protein